MWIQPTFWRYTDHDNSQTHDFTIFSFVFKNIFYFKTGNFQNWEQTKANEMSLATSLKCKSEAALLDVIDKTLDQIQRIPQKYM